MDMKIARLNQEMFKAKHSNLLPWQLKTKQEFINDVKVSEETMLERSKSKDWKKKVPE